MGLQRVDLYRSDGRFKLGDAGWSLYAAFAVPRAGEGLIKVGISSVPLRRIHEVHCGCPYPIKVALWQHVGWKTQAVNIERRIKRRFSERQTRGEWFSFELGKSEDKEFFHETCKDAYKRVTRRPLIWNKTSMEQVREALNLPWYALRA